MLTSSDRARLESARNLWLATVRPDASPHLVPIWFVWWNDKAYLCTSLDSVKARNIRMNPRVVFALEDGDDPVLLEATARILAEPPPEVVDAFLKKFEWDIRGDSTYNGVIELSPVRVVL
jgi:general stress protein 26